MNYFLINENELINDMIIESVSNENDIRILSNGVVVLEFTMKYPNSMVGRPRIEYNDLKAILKQES